MNEMHDLRNLITCSKKQKTTNINDISTEKKQNRQMQIYAKKKKKMMLKRRIFFQKNIERLLSQNLKLSTI